MRRWGIGTAVLVALVCARPGLAQTSDTSSSDQQSITDAVNGLSDTPTSVQDLLKSQRNLFITQMIHLMFQEIRSILGLPAVSDDNSDLLSLFESAVVASFNDTSDTASDGSSP